MNLFCKSFVGLGMQFTAFDYVNLNFGFYKRCVNQSLKICTQHMQQFNIKSRGKTMKKRQKSLFEFYWKQSKRTEYMYYIELSNMTCLNVTFYEVVHTQSYTITSFFICHLGGYVVNLIMVHFHYSTSTLNIQRYLYS